MATKQMTNNNSFSEYSNKELFVLYQNDKSIEIRNELIKRYLYITEILSKKFINKGIEYDDIVQVASVGLIYAIERFDSSKGFEFSSFATPTIIGEIKKYFRDKGWSLRVPRRIQELSKKVSDARNELQNTLERPPTVEDIALKLEISEEEVIEAMEASQVYAPKSLDIFYENSGDDKEMQLQDMIGIEDKEFGAIENRDFINMCLADMELIERQIVEKRYYEGKTQIQVANEIGISQMTVSRLEKKIIKKFKKEMERINNI